MFMGFIEKVQKLIRSVLSAINNKATRIPDIIFLSRLVLLLEQGFLQLHLFSLCMFTGAKPEEFSRGAKKVFLRQIRNRTKKALLANLKVSLLKGTFLRFIMTGNS